MHKQLACIALVAATSSFAQDTANIHTDAATGSMHQKYNIGSPPHKWLDCQFNWLYNPANQPAGMSTDQVVNILKNAANRWSEVCNVTFNYMGTTVKAPDIYGVAGAVDFQNVIGWGVPQAAQQSGMFMYKRWSSNSDGGLMDVDVLLNTTVNLSLSDLDGAATYAMGVVIGLNASNVDESILSSTVNHSTNYMRTLRGDDVAGCAALYGAPPTANSSRAFNWAEATYPQLLTPSPAAAGSAMGYFYRYYSGTNSYVGTKDGAVFYMGPNGVIQNMGPLSNFMPQVQAAGF